MHDSDLILTLTGGLLAALPLGYLTQRLGLSPIVGYLLAGIVVGPNTPGFVANRAFADQFAEIGVILLMFGVGLHFHVGELLAVRRVAIPGAIGQSLAATMLGWWVGTSFGWSHLAGIVFGLAISVASTVVLLRVLSDNHDLHTPAGHIAVGWLIVEDLLTVLLLVLLPVLFGVGARGGEELVAAIAVSLVKIALLVVFTIFVGRRLLPWILARVAATRSRELFTLAVLAVALGIAVGSAKVFGVSMALGAFLAGMVIGRSDFALRAASEALPMRDAFAVLFFVSVGMLFDPSYLLASPGLVLATLGVVLLGKPVAAALIVLALGHAPRVALAVAAALAQIGEFSFILAAVGRDLGILGESATHALVATAILSISVNPVAYRSLGWIDAWMGRRPRWSRWYLGKSGATRPGPVAAVVSGSGHEAIVVGYGPVGRTVARLLRGNAITPVVVEMNHATVRELNAAGSAAVYGDAARRETLEGAGASRAVALILSSSGMAGTAEAIRVARELNPRIRVFARADNLRDVATLRAAGADYVLAGEGEIALGMTELLLRQLGATSEEIERERERIRAELIGELPSSGWWWRRRGVTPDPGAAPESSTGGGKS